MKILKKMETFYRDLIEKKTVEFKNTFNKLKLKIQRKKKKMRI